MHRLAALIPLLLLLIWQPQTHGAGTTHPSRLVSTDAAATEILVMLGVDSRLVAVDSSSAMPVDRSLPRLGYHRALATEGLLALQPDLVIGAITMGPPHVLKQLERAGIPVLQLPTAMSVAQLVDNVVRVAAATRSESSAAAIGDLVATGERLAAERFSNMRGAFLLRAEGGKLRLAGRGTAGAGFLELLGLDSVANYDGYRSITAEGVLQLAPDVLLLADTQGNGAESLLQRFPLLRFSHAVRSGRLYSVDPQSLVAGISPSALDEAALILRTDVAEVGRP